VSARRSGRNPQFKPGVYLFVGDDEWSSYAESANHAMEAAGITVAAARGYHAYYEERRRRSPAGAKFLRDPTYVLLVGRKPEG